MNNRLNPCWFAPGDVLAQVETPEGKIVFKVCGEFRAELYDSEGVLIGTFDGPLFPVEDAGDGLHILDDEDLSAATRGTLPSGHYLKILSQNSVFVFVQNKDIEPIEINRESVARAILNPRVVPELVLAAKHLDKSGTVEKGPEPSGSDERKAALEKGLESIEESAMDAGLKTAVASAKESEDIKKKETDTVATKEKKIAETTEQTKVSSEKAVKESKKTPVKATKSSKPMEEVGVGRFDLLPLDVMSRILHDAADSHDNADVLMSIEEFKQTDNSDALVEAAISLALSNYPSGVDFILALALYVEDEVGQFGEDSWKNKDIIRCVNESVRDYLLFIKNGNANGEILRVVWDLICASRIAKEEE